MKTAKQSGNECGFVRVFSPLKNGLLRKPIFMILWMRNFKVTSMSWMGYCNWQDMFQNFIPQKVYPCSS